LAGSDCVYKCNGYTDGGVHDPSYPNDSTAAGDCTQVPQEKKVCQQDSLWFSNGAMYWFKNANQCNECTANNGWFKAEDGACERQQTCSKAQDEWFLTPNQNKSKKKKKADK